MECLGIAAATANARTQEAKEVLAVVCITRTAVSVHKHGVSTYRRHPAEAR